MTARRVAGLYAAAVALVAAAVYWSYRVTHPSRTPIRGRDGQGLVAGIGKLHHTILTRSEEAQRFFDQGLTFVYAFEFARAGQSFRRAHELDPAAAMPYWGIALAVGPNYNDPDPPVGRSRAAAVAVREAARVIASAGLGVVSEEGALVDALSRRYSGLDAPDPKAAGREYASAMKQVHLRFPDDPDAAVLYAESLMDLRPWALWSNSGRPAEGTLEAVSVLDDVIRRWPEHVGANHLYIHALESSPYPGRALASARRLETLAPACSHLVHMPAHVNFRTGDYGAAVRVSLRAVAVDDENATRGYVSG
jgi:hypothetical protein